MNSRMGQRDRDRRMDTGKREHGWKHMPHRQWKACTWMDSTAQDGCMTAGSAWIASGCTTVLTAGGVCASHLQKLAFILRRCAGGWSEPLLLLLPPQTLLPLLLLAWL